MFWFSFLNIFPLCQTCETEPPCNPYLVSVNHFTNWDIDDRLGDFGQIRVLVHIEVHFWLLYTANGSKVFPTHRNKTHLPWLTIRALSRNWISSTVKGNSLEPSMCIHDVLVHAWQVGTLPSKLKMIVIFQRGTLPHNNHSIVRESNQIQLTPLLEAANCRILAMEPRFLRWSLVSARLGPTSMMSKASGATMAELI